ncbi:LOW QUALITY PROTEIN: hypothetical protein PoB_004392900 [Plakobranchus ocellatus]|uniref:Uncharacterized protein n=1 Tax=Plakobranchus ocellatus TaxID=259542 RepID=A0AAV4BF20_9GAST|nr:LOW QUALITY PROTEIN: hypothetical protein PoB_004392900 [Plakobranchus ocellatus]
MSQTRLTQGFGGKINGTSKSTLGLPRLPLDIGLPLGVGSPSGRWVRAVPSSSGRYHHRSSSLAGLRSLPRPRCPTTGTRQHILSGSAHGHHVVALTSGSGSCLCPLHVTTGTRSGKRQIRLHKILRALLHHSNINGVDSFKNTKNC